METYSKSWLANKFDVDRRSIDTYISEVYEPCHINGKRHEWSIAVAAIALAPLLITRGKVELGDDDERDPERMEPINRKHHYDAELKKAQVEALQRSLIPVEEVRETAATAFKSLSLGLDIIPDRIELECGLASDQIKSMTRIIAEHKSNLMADLLGEFQ